MGIDKDEIFTANYFLVVFSAPLQHDFCAPVQAFLSVLVHLVLSLALTALFGLSVVRLPADTGTIVPMKRTKLTIAKAFFMIFILF
jgi:hypothetical protein